MFKVLMTDSVFEDTKIEEEALSKIDAEFILAGNTDEATLIEKGRDCDAILNTNAIITRKILEECRRVKIVARTGIGIDNVDVAAASELGVMVSNVPDYCLEEVANHTFALFLDLNRKITFYDKLLKKPEALPWGANTGSPVKRVSGQRFCLIGFGNIARLVAARALAFGMVVCAYDPYVPDEVFAAQGVTRLKTIKELATGADVLSLHIPLNEQSRGIVDMDILRLMNPTAFLINTSRGALVNQDDLIHALKTGVISGAALDATAPEPLPLDSELLKMDQVLLTPHVGFYSVEAGIDSRTKMSAEVVSVLSGGLPRSFCNRDTIINKR